MLTQAASLAGAVRLPGSAARQSLRRPLLPARRTPALQPRRAALRCIAHGGHGCSHGHSHEHEHHEHSCSGDHSGHSCGHSHDHGGPDLHNPVHK